MRQSAELGEKDSTRPAGAASARISAARCILAWPLLREEQPMATTVPKVITQQRWNNAG